MKGLLLKDWFMAKKYCRAWGLITLLFLAMSVVNRENLFFLVYPTLLSSLLPVTLLSYDERFHFDSYAAALPCSRAQLVTEKYLFGLLAILLALLLTLAALVIRKSSPWELLTLLSLLLGVGLLLSAMSLPVMFRFGVEKGRIAYYVLIGVMSALAVLSSGVLSDIPQPEPAFGPAILAAPLVCLGFWFLSLRLAIRLYEKRVL